jgi:hypothetical protein
LKFCMSNLGVFFHIWCRLDLFWSVRGLTSKMPTCPLHSLIGTSLAKAFAKLMRMSHFTSNVHSISETIRQFFKFWSLVPKIIQNIYKQMLIS